MYIVSLGAAGYGVSDVLFNIVITGSINLIFTLVALRFVDSFGRRPLMLLGCAGVVCQGKQNMEQPDSMFCLPWHTTPARVDSPFSF
jgi:hypothetical protein